MIPDFGFRKKFSDLSEKEILALAISSEEDDASIYRNYAEYLKNDYDMLHKQIEGILEYHRTHKKEIPKTSEENTSQGGTIAIITFVVCFIIGLILGHYFL